MIPGLLLEGLRWLALDMAFIFATWLLYLAVMNLAVNRAKMTGVSRFLGYCVALPVGVFCDFLLNLHFCLVIGRRPRDWLLTGTLQRLRNTEPIGSKLEITAAWICTHLLNPFDMTKERHC